MNYNQFVKNNIDALTHNYKSRLKFVHDTPFWEYCDYIYTGIKNGAYLPKEYTKNINYKEQQK